MNSFFIDIYSTGEKFWNYIQTQNFEKAFFYPAFIFFTQGYTLIYRETSGASWVLIIEFFSPNLRGRVREREG